MSELDLRLQGVRMPAKLSAASKLSAFASAPPSMRGDSASSEEEHIQAEPERPPDVDVEKGSS